MNAQSLKLAEIVTDAGTQTRCCITEDVVAEYAERWLEGDKFPPVIVFHDGTAYYLADGFHRVLAAQRNGFKDILAEVHKGTVKDALKYALGANQANGLRRTVRDKNRCVWLALDSFSNLSDRQIADMCGVSNTFVGNVRKEHSQLSTVDSSKRTGADGKTRKLPERKQESASDVEGDTRIDARIAEQENTVRTEAGTTQDIAGDPFSEPEQPKADYFKERLVFLEQAIQQVRRDFPGRNIEVIGWLRGLANEVEAQVTIAA